MKLKHGDRIKSDTSIFLVEAVLWSTVYLQEMNTGTNVNQYDYDMKEIYEFYKDVEILRQERTYG